LLRVPDLSHVHHLVTRELLIMSNRFHSITTRRSATAFFALIALAALGACSADVANPGPLEDSQLNTPAAVPALVNGMSGALSYALGNYDERGALASGELTEAGQYAAENSYYLGQL